MAFVEGARSAVRRLQRRVTWSLNRRGGEGIIVGNAEAVLRELQSFCAMHEKVRYTIGAIDIGGDDDRAYKWVGAQEYRGAFYCVPNGASFVLGWRYPSKIDEIVVPNSSKMPFEWTGGSVVGNELVCFPRSSNYLLKCNLGSRRCSFVDLGQDYRGEHHYGGVVVGAQFVYQPPRNTDHILKISLRDGRSTAIPIAPSFLGAKLRYCGSFAHPNGLLYFFPERDERVLVLDPKTDEFAYIGAPVDSMTFDVAMTPDGDLYGFSAYEDGLLHVGVKDERVEMVGKEYGAMGCYGTKLGVNGKLYGLPGTGNAIYEFDPATTVVERMCIVDGKGLVSCAGGAVARDGSIVAAPAQGRAIFMLTPDDEVSIPEHLYTTCFADCY